MFKEELFQEQHWYAVHVRPRCENVVANRFRELGIEEFLPTRKGSTCSRRASLPELPLFPGYVFICCDLRSGPRLYLIPGVVRILGSAGHATPIEEHEISTVRRIAESSLTVEPVPYLQCGDRVLLVDGPLTGVAGSFLSSGKGNKVVVSLPLLRRALAVTVPLEWVQTEVPTRAGQVPGLTS